MMDNQTATEYDLQTLHKHMTVQLFLGRGRTGDFFINRFLFRAYYLYRDNTTAVSFIAFLKMTINHAVHLTETNDQDLIQDTLALITIPEVLGICTCCHIFLLIWHERSKVNFLAAKKQLSTYEFILIGTKASVFILEKFNPYFCLNLQFNHKNLNYPQLR